MSSPKAPKRSSTATRLIQAAALAAVLVPLGTVSVQTSSIKCGFGAYYTLSDAACIGENGTSADFDFRSVVGGGGYDFFLSFTGRSGDFFVTIEDRRMNAGTFAPRAGAFPGYECVPIDPFSAPTDPCRDFFFTSVPAFTEGHWTGYEFEIDWDFNTEVAGFPNDGGLVRLLHNKGTVSGDAYDNDMCITPGEGCTYFPSLPFGDPGISSMDVDFQSFAVAYNRAAAVPEPASLLLVGTGVTGFLYRRRRRKNL